MTKPSALLIDGDILCYKAAWKAQESIDWEDGDDVQVLANVAVAEETLDSAIAGYREALGNACPFVCLSDTRNWRKELWPEYKAHRKDLAKPVLLDFCKEYLARHYKCLCHCRLEADDVMGIGATRDPNAVMVSIDKDMKTVPGKLYNPNHSEDGIVQISIVDAFKNHMSQTLTGDSTDGYKGCPDVGEKKAQAVIDSLEPPKHNRKQFKEWRKQLWQLVVEKYLEKGLKEEDALLNARLANILTFKRYDPSTAKVLLWAAPH